MSWFNLNLKTQVAGLWDISLYDKQCFWWGIGSVFLSRLRVFLPKFNFWKEYFSPLRARLCLQKRISLQLRQHCRWYFGWLWQIQNQKQWMMMRRAGLSTAACRNELFYLLGSKDALEIALLEEKNTFWCNIISQNWPVPQTVDDFWNIKLDSHHGFWCNIITTPELKWILTMASQ